jgi:hypothetical protein
MILQCAVACTHTSNLLGYYYIPAVAHKLGFNLSAEHMLWVQRQERDRLREQARASDKTTRIRAAVRAGRQRQLNLDLNALSSKLTPRLHESHTKGYAPLALAKGCNCFFKTLPGHTAQSPQWTCALCQEPQANSKLVKFAMCSTHAQGTKHGQKWVDYHTVASLVKSGHMETSPFAHLTVQCTCAAPRQDEDTMPE